MRNFYSLKDLVKRIQRQVRYQEDLFAKNICLSKDSHLKCIKISQSSTLNETNNPVRKSDKIQRYFIKKDVWLANKHLKRFKKSLSLRGMHIKIDYDELSLPIM